MDSNEYVLIKCGVLSNVYLNHYDIKDEDTYNKFLKLIGLERISDKLCTVHGNDFNYYKYRIIDKHLYFLARMHYGI